MVGVEGVDGLEGSHRVGKGGGPALRLLLAQLEVAELVGVVAQHERAPALPQRRHVRAARAELGEALGAAVGQQVRERLLERHRPRALEEARPPVLLLAGRARGLPALAVVVVVVVVARLARAAEQLLVGQQPLLEVVAQDRRRRLVARVVERREVEAVRPVDVGAELEERLRHPVVAARRRRHQRRHVPARLVDGRARLDEQPRHLAVALRLVDARHLQRRHQVAVLLAQQPRRRPAQQLAHDQLAARERRDRERRVAVVVDGERGVLGARELPAQRHVAARHAVVQRRPPERVARRHERAVRHLAARERRVDERVHLGEPRLAVAQHRVQLLAHAHQRARRRAGQRQRRARGLHELNRDGVDVEQDLRDPRDVTQRADRLAARQQHVLRLGPPVRPLHQGVGRARPWAAPALDAQIRKSARGRSGGRPLLGVRPHERLDDRLGAGARVPRDRQRDLEEQVLRLCPVTPVPCRDG